MSGTLGFNEALKVAFGAKQGGYSVVTSTEAKDGQVTVIGEEKDLLLSFFGEDDLSRFQGNDRDLTQQGLDARREFRLWPTGEVVRPKLKYPKPGNNELRLYFNAAEFKVREDHYWGVFERDEAVWLFNSTVKFLERLRAGEYTTGNRGQALEEERDDYQEAINSAPPKEVISSQKSWKRDPKIAAKALNAASFRCEIFPDLPTFVSRSTGNPFVEAHHLIPMKLQDDFEMSLDVSENICSLSPYAHRKIHLGRFDDIVSDLQILISKRETLLDYAGVSADEILSLYRV